MKQIRYNSERKPPKKRKNSVLNLRKIGLTKINCKSSCLDVLARLDEQVDVRRYAAVGTELIAYQNLLTFVHGSCIICIGSKCVIGLYRSRCYFFYRSNIIKNFFAVCEICIFFLISRVVLLYFEQIKIILYFFQNICRFCAFCVIMIPYAKCERSELIHG